MSITDEQCEAFARAHDRENAAQIGMPSPWDVPYIDPQQEAEWRAERLAAVRAGLEAVPVLAHAQEMLEALKALFNRNVRYEGNNIVIPLGSHGDAIGHVRFARAAIRKAEGRDQ